MKQRTGEIGLPIKTTVLGLTSLAIDLRREMNAPNQAASAALDPAATSYEWEAWALVGRQYDPVLNPPEARRLGEMGSARAIAAMGSAHRVMRERKAANEGTHPVYWMGFHSLGSA